MKQTWLYIIVVLNMTTAFAQGMTKDSEGELTPSQKHLIKVLVAQGNTTLVFKGLMKEVIYQKKPLHALRYFLSLDSVSVNNPEVLAAHDAAGLDRCDVLRLLIAHGIDLDTPEPKTLLTPLHYAVHCSVSIEMVKLLLDTGAPLHAREALGAQPIHYAVNEGNIELLEVLWQRGADPRSLIEGGRALSGMAGFSLLHICIESPHIGNRRELLRSILLLGIPVDTSSRQGSSALERALLIGNEQMRNALISYGASIQLSESDIRMTIYRFADEQEEAAAERIKEYESQKRVAHSFLKLLQNIFEQITKIDNDEHAKSVLSTIGVAQVFCMAAGQGEWDVVNYVLIHLRSAINVADMMTAFFGAATAGHLNIVTCLWEDIRNDQHISPLAMLMAQDALALAAAQQHWDVCLYLVRVGVPLERALNRLRVLAKHPLYSRRDRSAYNRMLNVLSSSEVRPHPEMQEFDQEGVTRNL